MKKTVIKLLALVLLLGVIGAYYLLNTPATPQNPGVDVNEVTVKENEAYTSMEEVSAYLIAYHKLPDNYITKTKAKKLGWEQEKGNLHDVCKGCSIGGGPYNNLEGILPEYENYYECDIDYKGGARNAKRLVYTKWGKIYYTDDHYETFVLIYDEDEN